ncbi:MAG: hypothetical protein C0484_10825 [Rhodospirillum sp.]|jgi:hypothetical protein|nr:hypothetical protein [Rhodospirillum sp.]
MKKFRILIRGENFFMKSEGAVRRFGFYTTRFAEAQDEAEAERLVVEAFRQEGQLRGRVLNDRSDPPMLFAEEIVEIASFEGVETRTPGLAFYEDQPPAH